MFKLTRLFNLSAQTRLEPEGRPFRFDVPGAREVFLLLHGFTGIPHELAGVGAALVQEGFASYAPRYPGHGTVRMDFLASGAEDWVRRAVDSYLDLRSEYEAVHILGHSMGGLIAAALAAATNAPKLVLFAPAFMLSSKVVRFTPLLAPFVSVIHTNRPVPDTETDPVRRRLYADYWADDHIAGAANLERIRKTAIHLLPQVRSRVLVVTGEKDQTVLPSVGEFLRTSMVNAASFESKIINGAGHRFPFDENSVQAAALVREWVSKA